MTTQQEQVAHIEAGLRRRFFPHVPKVELPQRSGWTEDQHDLDRLSRALAAYALVALANMDDAAAAAALTDGRDDGGIDSILYDRHQSRLLIVQSKFKRGGAAPSQEENLKTINGVKALMGRRFHEFNASFQNRLDEIEEALDEPGVLLDIRLVFPGDAVGQHVTNDLNALRAELNALAPRCGWTACGLKTVHDWLLAEETPAEVTADITLENWACVTTPRKAIYGQLSAAELVALVDQHGRALFERNIRHYLGSVGVNHAIAETARRRPTDFFYLNNGLTAVAETITPAAGTTACCAFRMTKLSIVNGAQTAGSITTAAVTGAISADAKILLTVIELGPAPDDLGLRITRARNYQNVVRGVDFAALDPNQERLRRELAVVGITYHYRPSAEARARRDDAFTLEEAALALACFSPRILTAAEVRHQHTLGRRPVNAIDFVVAAKKEVGRLWDQDGPHYPALFPESLAGVRVGRLVKLFRFIDQILAGSESAENGYLRRMFFRHGRYFLMAVVAHRSQDIIGRPTIHLIDNDKNLISQRVNQLGELVYAESLPLTAQKGYLAIFRNLGDAQPLADRVLRRLMDVDAAAAAPPAS